MKLRLLLSLLDLGMSLHIVGVFSRHNFYSKAAVFL
jgi:hypothetical protein